MFHVFVEAEQINVYAQTSYKGTKKLGFILSFLLFLFWNGYLDIWVDIALIGDGFLTNVLLYFLDVDGKGRGCVDITYWL